MEKERFIEELKNIGINISLTQLDKLDKYYELLVNYNKFVNLTAIIDEKSVYLKHFYDSLTLIKAINLTNNYTICDIGTGAGFPGIVLKILFPHLSITLVDSLQKRINFLNIVIEKLELEDIKAVHTRIEDYDMEEKFDIVVSRAVSYTPTLLELGSRLPKINGYFVLMKGNVEEELENSKKAIAILKYELSDVISFKLPIENSERNIVVLKKIDKTPKKYPRKFKDIKANSL